jgi:hypothetical protein
LVKPFFQLVRAFRLYRNGSPYFRRHEESASIIVQSYLRNASRLRLSHGPRPLSLGWPFADR